MLLQDLLVGAGLGSMAGRLIVHRLERGLQDLAWGLGDVLGIAAALLLTSLADREFFWDA